MTIKVRIVPDYIALLTFMSISASLSSAASTSLSCKINVQILFEKGHQCMLKCTLSKFLTYLCKELHAVFYFIRLLFLFQISALKFFILIYQLLV